MPISVAPISTAELPAFIDTMSATFLDRPDIARVAAEVEPFWDLSRAWAARDHSRIIGTFRSWPTEITVPGGQRLPAAAVTNVTVLPTHRRRGVLRAMVAADHGASRARGEALSLLYAAEYPIYGRFGYGPACRLATVLLDTHGTTFHTAAAGSVEFIAPGEEASQAMRAVYEAWRAAHAGEIRRREFRWEIDLGLREVAWGTRWKGFFAVHRDGSGTIDGYVRYRADEKWEQGQPRSIVNLDELQALTGEAHHALWRFLAEIDLVSTVKAENRPAGERLPWLLTNARAAVVSELSDGMWVRVFDPGRALGARGYDLEGRLVLEVIDPEAPNGRVRLALDAGGGGATAVETTRNADLTLDVAALSAAYLGGTRLRDAVLATGVDEHTAGALATADALLHTADQPWGSTFF